VLISASMRSFIDDSVADRRFITLMLSATGCLALLMAAAGVYGVAAYTASRRVQEIGIRMALGATPAGVHGLLLREELVRVALGLAIGLSSAVAVLQALRGRLQGFEAPQAALVATAVAVVVSMSGLASWIPTRRAVRIDPISALRQE
jgi:putative ABC transport system permease protein